MKDEGDGAQEQPEEGEPVEAPARGVPRHRVARGVASEVLETAHSVGSAQKRSDARVLQPTEQQQRQELRHELQAVLVPSLHAVERLGVLVLALVRVHDGVRHSVFPPRLPDLFHIV